MGDTDIDCMVDKAQIDPTTEVFGLTPEELDAFAQDCDIDLSKLSYYND